MKHLVQASSALCICAALAIHAEGPAAATPSDGDLGTPGSIAWQYSLDGAYSFVRPVVAPSGVVYVVDASGALHAVNPDGSLLWKVGAAGSKGLAVGPDGTAYVGSEDFVRAYGPDGTLQWSFQQSPRAFVFVGLGLGPDGNLYCLGTHGLGVFSLTPQGALRWASPELYDRPMVSYGEIVFGPGFAPGTTTRPSRQLYFYANAHIRAVRLDGGSVFTLARGGQPVVSPLDGTMHVGDAAYHPSGTPYWAGGIFSGANAALASDGSHYLAGFGNVYSLDRNGSSRWTRSDSDYLNASAVDPSNTLALFVGNAAVDFAGVISAYDTASGTRVWRLGLPPVGGSSQAPEQRPAFSADGNTAYYVTSVSGTIPQHAWLTAITLR